MPNDNYANEPNNSRAEFIIQSILDGTEYDEPAQSRIEYLLKQLKAFIAELVTKGVSLIGETSTALVDNATTNPITVNGESYTVQPNDAVIYGHKEFLFDGTKWHEFGDLSGLSSKDIGAMTDYVKAVTSADIDPTDTLNQAIGKLEKRVSDNKNNILSNYNNIVHLDYGNNDISVFGLDKFAIGGLNIDGSLKPEQTSRVSNTQTITTPPYDITLLLAPDYRVGYIPFVDGTPSEWVNWAYNSMIIPANTTLKFQIGRPTEAGTVGNIKEYTQAVKIIPNKKPAITNIDDFSFGRGTIRADGSIDMDSTRVYTSAINVEQLSRVIISANDNYTFGWHTYDEKFRSVDNATAFSTTPIELDVSNVNYLRINVKRLDNATMYLDEVPNIKLKVVDASQFSNKNKLYNYFGTVNLNGTYTVDNYVTYTPTSSSLPSTTQQGMSIYNGKAFLLYNKGGLAIYDLINKQSIAEITLASASAGNHCNSCNFSNEIISGGIYPLLYISECYGQHRCFVENITNSGSTIVQTITFNNENGDYTNSTYNNAFDWILDNDTGMLMTYGIMSDGKHKIKMFAKPDISSATVTLGEKDVIDEWVVEDYIYPTLSSNYTYQGNCAKGGIIYLLTWQSNEIICISEDTHAMTARVPLTYNTTGEPEDLAIYADTMFVVYGDKKIYGMSFD